MKKPFSQLLSWLLDRDLLYSGNSINVHNAAKSMDGTLQHLSPMEAQLIFNEPGVLLYLILYFC